MIIDRQRVKGYTIHPDVFLSLTHDSVCAFTPKIPEGSTVKSVDYMPEYQRIMLTIQNNTFDIVPEGERMPLIELEIGIRGLG